MRRRAAAATLHAAACSHMWWMVWQYHRAVVPHVRRITPRRCLTLLLCRTYAILTCRAMPPMMTIATARSQDTGDVAASLKCGLVSIPKGLSLK